MGQLAGMLERCPITRNNHNSDQTITDTTREQPIVCENLITISVYHMKRSLCQCCVFVEYVTGLQDYRITGLQELAHSENPRYDDISAHEIFITLGLRRNPTDGMLIRPFLI
jgi:hypothetical protein